VPDALGSSLAAQKLCYVFRYVKESCHVKGNVAQVGERSIPVDLTIVFQTHSNLPGGSARNLSVAFSMAGEPPNYAVQSLARGSDARDALDRGAQEWAALAGTAVVDAFRDTGVSVAAHQVSRHPGDAPVAVQRGPFHAYPGVGDFRGAPKGGPFLDHEALLGSLAGSIDGLDPSKPHSLYLAMKHDGQSMTCERGQIDGVDVGAVCERAAGASWAEPLSPYMVRQFYMLMPGRGPVPVVVPEEGAPAEAVPGQSAGTAGE